MKTIRLALALLILWAVPALATITHVQDGAANSDTVCSGAMATVSITPSSATDSLVVCVCSRGTIVDPTGVSVADTENGGANVWTRHMNQGNPNSSQSVCTEFDTPKANGTGADTITVTLSGGSGSCLDEAVPMEFAGANGTLTGDQQTSFGQTSVDVVTGTITPTNANELTIGCGINSTSGSAYSSGPTNTGGGTTSSGPANVTGITNTVLFLAGWAVTSNTGTVGFQWVTTAGTSGGIGAIVDLIPAPPSVANGIRLISR